MFAIQSGRPRYMFAVRNCRLTRGAASNVMSLICFAGRAAEPAFSSLPAPSTEQGSSPAVPGDAQPLGAPSNESRRGSCCSGAS